MAFAAEAAVRPRCMSELWYCELMSLRRHMVTCIASMLACLFLLCSSNDPTNIASEMHTALHELGHVFGLANPVISAATTTPPAPATSMFLGPLGTILDPRGNVYIEELDPIRGRKVAKIVTPRVLNLTRAVFDCPTATGLPLEDVELGKGAHWEAAYTGPELMSYGSGSGQVSISDFSLAFLEDTNQVRELRSLMQSPDTALCRDAAGHPQLPAHPCSRPPSAACACVHT